MRPRGAVRGKTALDGGVPLAAAHSPYLKLARAIPIFRPLDPDESAAEQMPIYAYECGACGATHDFLQKMGEGRKRKCPSCGALRLRKLVTAAAFHLKGTGWYVTDFRDKDKKKEPEEGAEKKKPEGESKTEAGGKKDSSSSGDAKSASAGKAPASTSGGGSSASVPAD